MHVSGLPSDHFELYCALGLVAVCVDHRSGKPAGFVLSYVMGLKHTEGEVSSSSKVP